jgi:hypothetical protein
VDFRTTILLVEPSNLRCHMEKSELLDPNLGQPSYTYRIEFANPEDRAYVCAMYGPPRDEEGLNAFARQLGDAYSKVADDPSYAGLPVPPISFRTQRGADSEAVRQILKGGIAQGCLWAQQFGPDTNLAIDLANGAGANTFRAQAINGDNRIVAEQSGLANDARNVPVLGRRAIARDSSDNGFGNSASSADGIDPMNPAQPTPLPLADSSPVRRLVRVNGNASPAMSVVSSDGRGSLGDLSGNQTSSPNGISPRNPNLPVPLPETERSLGIVSGKPMPLWTTPPSIFNTRDKSDAADDQNRLTTLGGLLWGGGKSQASALAAGAPAVTAGSIFWQASLPRVRDSLSYCRKLLAASRYLSRRSTEQSRTSLPRRANHRHIVIIARIEPAPGNRPRAFA